MTSAPNPQRYKETWVDTYKDRFIVYNPTSRIGPVLMNNEFYSLYSLIDGKRSVKEIFNVADKLFRGLTLTDLEQILTFFNKNELVYFGTPSTYGAIQNHISDTLHVWFHITNQCNLACSYCFVGKSTEHMSSENIKNSIENIFKSGKRHGLKRIHIAFSGGEPLLMLKEILPAARLAQRLGIKYGIATTLDAITNGVLLTKKAVASLKEVHMKLAVSLDGLDKFQDKTRYFNNHKGSFAYAIRGFENAREAGIISHVNITVTKYNVLHLPVIAEYLLKRKVKFSFQYYSDTPHSTENLRANDDLLISSISKTIKLIHKYLPPYKVIDYLSHNVSFANPRYSCGAGTGSYLIVKQDGKVAGCNFDLDRSIGSIDDKDIATLPKRNGYIKPILSLKQKAVCTTCRWRYICSACPLHAMEDKTLKAPPYCEVNKKIIPQLIRLEVERLVKYGHPPKHL